jgi:hypothetical protein
MNGKDSFKDFLSTLMLIKSRNQNGAYILGNTAFKFPYEYFNWFSADDVLKNLKEMAGQKKEPEVFLRFDGNVVTAKDALQLFREYLNSGFLSEYGIKANPLPPIEIDQQYVYNKGDYITVVLTSSFNSRNSITYGPVKVASAVIIADKKRRKLLHEITIRTKDQSIEYDKDNNITYFIDSFANTVTVYSVKDNSVEVNKYHASKIIPAHSYGSKYNNRADHRKYGSLTGVYMFDIDKNDMVQDIYFLTAINGEATKIHVASREKQPEVFKYLDLHYAISYIQALVIDGKKFAFKFLFSEVGRDVASSAVRDDLKYYPVIVRTKSMPDELIDYMKSDTKFIYTVASVKNTVIFSLQDFVPKNTIKYAVVRNGNIVNYIPSTFHKEKEGLVASTAYIGKNNFYIVETLPKQAETSVKRHRVIIANKDNGNVIATYGNSVHRVLPQTMVQPFRYIGVVNRKLKSNANAVFRVIDTETLQSKQLVLKDFYYTFGDIIRKYHDNRKVNSKALNNILLLANDKRIVIGIDRSVFKVSENDEKRIVYASAFAPLYYSDGDRVYTLFKKEKNYIDEIYIKPVVIVDSPYTILNFSELLKTVEKTENVEIER